MPTVCRIILDLRLPWADEAFYTWNRSKHDFIGIVLATAIASNRIRFMVMDASGEVIPCSEEDVQFVFRKYAALVPKSTKGKEREVPPVDLNVPREVLQNAFSLEDIIPREGLSETEQAEQNEAIGRRLSARRVLAKMLRKITIMAERRKGDLMREANGAYRPEGVWERVQQLEADTLEKGYWPAFTCEDILAYEYGSTKDEMTRFGLHTILMSRPDLFQADESDMKTSGKFAARPKGMVDDLRWGEKVFNAYEAEGEGEEASKIIKTFVEDTRKVVLARRESNGTIPTAYLSPGTRCFLRLLKQRVLEQRTIQASPYWPFVPTLLAATGLYEGEKLDISTLMRFLWEMGELGKHGNASSIKLRDLEVKEGDVRIHTQQEWPAPSATGSDDLAARLDSQDPHESVRKDFGTLPVYVIDAADAKELDDGISLERIPGTNDSWIHVHIADPTRWIAPGDDIASIAMRLGQTFYAAESGRPMMPNELVMSAMSLGAARGKSHGQVVISFSAKINEKGEMVDYKVQTGVVNNVKVITYDSVDQILSESKSTGSDQERTKDIQDLYTIALSLRKNRLRDSGLEWSLPQATVNPDSAGGSMQWNMPINERSSSRLLVSECMVMAGQIAGRFGAERNLTLPYRGSQIPFIPTRGLPSGWTSDRAIEELLKKRDPVTFEISPVEVARSNVFIRGSPPGPRPVDHWILGIKGENGGYSRVTSPLRRFGDMLGHWQIKQALLSGSSGNRTSSPLFDESYMEEMCVYMNKVDRRIKRLDLQSQQFLVASTIKQALDTGGLMDNGISLHDLSAHVMAHTEYSAVRRSQTTTIYIPSLALRAQLQRADVALDSGLRRWEIGEQLRVRIKEVMLWPTPFVNAEPL
jgi:exoribonuclease-2